MVVLENDNFKIEISEDGGALSSIYDKKNNTELMYEPDSRSWNGKDVVIFPFVARLKDSKYMVDDKEYHLKNHGIIRYRKLNVSYKSETEAVLNLNYDKDTLSIYPYKFNFFIKYTLDDNKLSIRYKVVNVDNKNIYYELGGHPALKVDGEDTGYSFEIKNTILEFENDIVTNKYYLNEDGSLITGKSINQIPRLLAVTKNLITEAKTIILDASDINSVKLKTLGYEYLFDLSEAPILALWTYPGYGDYLCVEPWWGIPDIINPNPELKDKPMMRSLNPNESEEVGYSITIIR